MSEEITYDYGSILLQMKYEEEINIKLIHVDEFNEWVNKKSEFVGSRGTSMNGKNVFEIIRKWINGDQEIRRYFVMVLYNAGEKENEPVICITQKNPLKELEEVYKIDFMNLDISNEVRIEKQLNKIKKGVKEIQDNLTDITNKVSDNFITEEILEKKIRKIISEENEKIMHGLDELNNRMKKLELEMINLKSELSS